MVITSRATIKAVSCSLPSKYTIFAPSRAEDNFDLGRSSGIMGGYPGVKMHVRVFLEHHRAMTLQEK